nr:dna damage-responsive transcriptional repressor rph1 [Quercus suber]
MAEPAQAAVQPSVENGQLPHSALTPPTSEELNMDTKKDSDESELSDLDLDDDDDLEDIEPDHYWEGGKIPVFKPTMEQFRSFKKFIGKVDKYGMKSGIVKVIPPKEWRDSLPALDEYVKRIRIKNPITQEFNGTFGTYTQQNVEKQRSYNLPEWKALTEETQHQPPAKRGERRRNQEKVVRGGSNLRARHNFNAVTTEADDNTRLKRKPGRPRRVPLPAEDLETDVNHNDPPDVPPTPDSLATKPEKKATKSRSRPSKNGNSAGQAKSVASRRLNNTSEAAEYIDEKAFKDFDYRMDGIDEFTPERCAELETHYWKSLAFNQPMYAADMPGSLFDDTTTSWNVAKLENLLDVLGTKVPGVNTAYLYMGMWKATFAWHLEDVDLYSINYIHFGAPKQWYSISQEDARKFEAAMKNNWPQDAKNCDQFLRHKTYLISPDVLQKQYGVKVNKLVHYEGEFVITYPYGYHSGYNIGYNCAESVNFATESWLEFGRIAKKCNCESDNVWVDVSEIERKLRGEPTPEYYEETDDEEDDVSEAEDGNLPSPPASIKGKAARGKKRQSEVKDGKPKRKKIKIRIKVSSREPCVMCPSDNPWEALIPTDTGKKVHRSCAVYTPETWIERDDAGREKVFGVANIDRARLDLKCIFCRSKRGACFQCSSKKCTRAYHATCALAGGVLIDGGMVPTFGEDGTEYYEEGYDFRCKYHRPKLPKIVNHENLEATKRVMNYAKELKYNDVIQVQFHGVEVFAGLVVENRPAEMMVLVDVLPEGERIEVEYKWIFVLDPDDSQRPKPSASAIPMPEGMNKKQVSVDNRQDGVPDQGDVFHTDPAYKSHEFYNLHFVVPGFAQNKFCPPSKLNVDIDAPDQLYYYLPKISTEAKSAYTDKVGGTEAVSKANFMDRVTPRPNYNQPRSHTLASAAAKKPISLSHNTSGPVRHHAPIMSAGNPYNVARCDKPYMYKPKEPMQPNYMWTIDPQALADQRSFVNQLEHEPSLFEHSPPPLDLLHTGYHGNDLDSIPSQARPFPRDQYYSANVLPAALPGEHSTFLEVAGVPRRTSHGPQSLSRPSSSNFKPKYQSVSQQKAYMKQAVPSAPMQATDATTLIPVHTMGPSSYASSASRPSSSSISHHSPPGAPATPATTISSTSKHPETSPGYLENLSKYPYLRNSYCRRPQVYESPYPIGGGFSSPYQPMTLSTNHSQMDEKRPPGAHTPPASVSSLDGGGQKLDVQWTPPSQIWDQRGLSKQPPFNATFQTPPPPPPSSQQSRLDSKHSLQAPVDLQQAFQSAMGPSTASRDGAQARAMRDQGYGPFAPHAYMSSQQRNNFGQPFDKSPAWTSPKAPIPSPLSDPNTPGVMLSHSHTTDPMPLTQHPWGIMPRLDATQGIMGGGRNSPAPGYGPMLPQMQGGHETWRYN